MSPTRSAVLAAVALFALAGCGLGDRPDRKHADAMLALYAEFEPYSICVQDAMSADPAFVGGLPDRVVAAGLAGELQGLAKRHLGQAADVAAQSPAMQVDSARTTLQALAAYGASRGAPADEPLPAQMRRLVSVVETTTLTARAFDAPCAPSEKLVTLMEQAEHDYF